MPAMEIDSVGVSPQAWVETLSQLVQHALPAMLVSVKSHRFQVKNEHSDLTLQTTFPPFEKVSAAVLPDATHLKNRLSNEAEQSVKSNEDGEQAESNTAAKTYKELIKEIAMLDLRKHTHQYYLKPFSPETADEVLSHSRSFTKDEVLDICDCIDLAIVLENLELVESNASWLLIEEILEVLSISSCSQIFDYIESRVPQLTIGLSPSRGKGLVLLRSCNELLRRLSKPKNPHTIFAGRILSLLSSVFPLGDRSGVNLRGDFNVENKTEWEKVEIPQRPEKEEPEDDETKTQEGLTKDAVGAESEETRAESGERKASKRPRSSSTERPDSTATRKDFAFHGSDPKFYTLFWSMQSFFANPKLLFSSKPIESAAIVPPAISSVGTGEEDGITGKKTPSGVALDDDYEDPAPQGATGPMEQLRKTTKRILSVLTAVEQREKELEGAASNENTRHRGVAVTVTEGRKGNTAFILDGNTGNNSTNSGTTTSTELPSTGPSISMDSAVKRHGVKRKELENPTDTAMDVDNEADIQLAEDGLESSSHGGFFPKFLTGRQIFEYELRDAKFRRHILIQYLILFQYLLGFSPSVQEKMQNWENKQLQLASSGFTLDEADNSWIRTTWKQVVDLLKETPPQGKVFTETVLHLLRRESMWIKWKIENCPPIDRPPMNSEQLQVFAQEQVKLLSPLREYPHLLGTAALTELWEEGLQPPKPGTRTIENENGMEVQVQTDGLEDLELFPTAPSLNVYTKTIKQQDARATMRRKKLQLELPSAEDTAKEVGGDNEKEVHEKLEKQLLEKEKSDEIINNVETTKQSLSWRALRIARSQHLHLFNKIGIDDLPALTKAIEEEKNPPPPSTTVSDLQPSSTDISSKETEDPDTSSQKAHPTEVSLPSAQESHHSDNAEDIGHIEDPLHSAVPIADSDNPLQNNKPSMESETVDSSFSSIQTDNPPDQTKNIPSLSTSPPFIPAEEKHPPEQDPNHSSKNEHRQEDGDGDRQGSEDKSAPSLPEQSTTPVNTAEASGNNTNTSETPGVTPTASRTPSFHGLPPRPSAEVIGEQRNAEGK